MQFDDVNVGGQLKVGTGIVPAIKEGDTKINGSAFVEGPAVIGAPTVFPFAYATLNVGQLTNGDPDVTPPFIPGALCSGVNNPYSLAVTGSAGFLGPLDTAANIGCGGNLLAQGNVISNCGGHILAAKKDFDIKHPSKEGWRLRYVAPEAPTADVYYRGKVVNKKEIILPKYWKDLVDWTTITAVSYTHLTLPTTPYV